MKKHATPDPSSSSKPHTHSKQKPGFHQTQTHARKTKHPQPSSDSNPTSLPGVQKLKAALRQTRRLLARPKLAADVRVATERRLRSLEGDLARAEQVRAERAWAARYHMVRFFERKKVERALRGVLRSLEGKGKKRSDGDDAGEGKTAGTKAQAKERRKLERRLEALRVDLNYVLHYPRTRKYISLFPPEVRTRPSGASSPTSPRAPNMPVQEREGEEETETETDRQREEVRAWVRAQMAEGTLSREPEHELLEGGPSTAASVSGRGAGLGRFKGKGTPTIAGEGEGKKAKAKAEDGKGEDRKGGVADDHFFGVDEDEDESSQDEDADDTESSADGDSTDSSMDED